MRNESVHLRDVNLFFDCLLTVINSIYFQSLANKMYEKYKREREKKQERRENVHETLFLRFLHKINMKMFVIRILRNQRRDTL